MTFPLPSFLRSAGALAAWLSGLAGAGAAEAPVPFTQASHEPRAPRAGEPVRIEVTAGSALSNVQVWTQTMDPGGYIELGDPGFAKGWVARPMTAGVSTNGAVRYGFQAPAEAQKNRRLVRYRFTANDAQGQIRHFPATNAVVPNLAYFVYDGIPAWTAAAAPRGRDPRLRQAVTYPEEAMRRVQSYLVVAKGRSVTNVTWREQARDKEYRYTVSVVADGVVYDHVRMRARGGVWRFSMVKNMWKFSFADGEPLLACDDYGRPYPVPWSKLNLRACIQQGDYGCRGEQGMFETVGFRLFNLASVPASRTFWVQLRFVTAPEESPKDPYNGDYWGLYLAIEDLDGRFLRGHGLPDGNIFRMESGTGTLAHHGAGAVTNRSDLFRFMRGYQSGSASAEEWWRSQVNLPAYYSYRAICECIHHYDIGGGKNYDYYFNPETQRWQVIPWDIDLTWADHMFGDGNEPFKYRILSRPGLKLEYQNRLREIRDLLYNPSETGRLIDECAAIVADPAGGPSPVGADRAKWDYHPRMVADSKAGQGLFYGIARTKDFPGMVRLMKDYVRRRGSWIDSVLAADPRLPRTPAIRYTGAAGFPSRGLRFAASEYAGEAPAAAAQWRLGEVALPVLEGGRPVWPGKYEIEDCWDSGELPPGSTEASVPDNVVEVGHHYRARFRVKDATGRWSHWSAPVQFTAGKP